MNELTFQKLFDTHEFRKKRNQYGLKRQLRFVSERIIVEYSPHDTISAREIIHPLDPYRTSEPFFTQELCKNANEYVTAIDFHEHSTYFPFATNNGDLRLLRYINNFDDRNFTKMSVQRILTMQNKTMHRVCHGAVDKAMVAICHYENSNMLQHKITVVDLVKPSKEIVTFNNDTTLNDICWTWHNETTLAMADDKAVRVSDVRCPQSYEAIFLSIGAERIATSPYRIGEVTIWDGSNFLVFDIRNISCPTVQYRCDYLKSEHVIDMRYNVYLPKQIFVQTNLDNVYALKIDEAKLLTTSYSSNLLLRDDERVTFKNVDRGLYMKRMRDGRKKLYNETNLEVDLLPYDQHFEMSKRNEICTVPSSYANNQENNDESGFHGVYDLETKIEMIYKVSNVNCFDFTYPGVSGIMVLRNDFKYKVFNHPVRIGEYCTLFTEDAINEMKQLQCREMIPSHMLFIMAKRLENGWNGLTTGVNLYELAQTITKGENQFWAIWLRNVTHVQYAGNEYSVISRRKKDSWLKNTRIFPDFTMPFYEQGCCTQGLKESSRMISHFFNLFFSKPIPDVINEPDVDQFDSDSLDNTVNELQNSVSNFSTSDADELNSVKVKENIIYGFNDSINKNFSSICEDVEILDEKRTFNFLQYVNPNDVIKKKPEKCENKGHSNEIPVSQPRSSPAKNKLRKNRMNHPPSQQKKQSTKEQIKLLYATYPKRLTAYRPKRLNEKSMVELILQSSSRLIENKRTMFFSHMLPTNENVLASINEELLIDLKVSLRRVKRCAWHTFYSRNFYNPPECSYNELLAALSLIYNNTIENNSLDDEVSERPSDDLTTVSSVRAISSSEIAIKNRSVDGGSSLKFDRSRTFSDDSGLTTFCFKRNDSQSQTEDYTDIESHLANLKAIARNRARKEKMEQDEVYNCNIGIDEDSELTTQSTSTIRTFSRERSISLTGAESLSEAPVLLRKSYSENSIEKLKFMDKSSQVEFRKSDLVMMPENPTYNENKRNSNVYTHISNMETNEAVKFHEWQSPMISYFDKTTNLYVERMVVLETETSQVESLLDEVKNVCAEYSIYDLTNPFNKMGLWISTFAHLNQEMVHNCDLSIGNDKKWNFNLFGDTGSLLSDVSQTVNFLNREFINYTTANYGRSLNISFFDCLEKPYYGLFTPENMFRVPVLSMRNNYRPPQKFIRPIPKRRKMSDTELSLKNILQRNQNKLNTDMLTKCSYCADDSNKEVCFKCHGEPIFYSCSTLQVSNDICHECNTPLYYLKCNQRRKLLSSQNLDTIMSNQTQFSNFNSIGSKYRYQAYGSLSTREFNSLMNELARKSNKTILNGEHRIHEVITALSEREFVEKQKPLVYDFMLREYESYSTNQENKKREETKHNHEFNELMKIVAKIEEKIAQVNATSAEGEMELITVVDKVTGLRIQRWVKVKSQSEKEEEARMKRKKKKRNSQDKQLINNPKLTDTTWNDESCVKDKSEIKDIDPYVIFPTQQMMIDYNIAPLKPRRVQMLARSKYQIIPYFANPQFKRQLRNCIKQTAVENRDNAIRKIVRKMNDQYRRKKGERLIDDTTRNISQTVLCNRRRRNHLNTIPKFSKKLQSITKKISRTDFSIYDARIYYNNMSNMPILNSSYCKLSKIREKMWNDQILSGFYSNFPKYLFWSASMSRNNLTSTRITKMKHSLKGSTSALKNMHHCDFDELRKYIFHSKSSRYKRFEMKGQRKNLKSFFLTDSRCRNCNHMFYNHGSKSVLKSTIKKQMRRLNSRYSKRIRKGEYLIRNFHTPLRKNPAMKQIINPQVKSSNNTTADIKTEPNIYGNYEKHTQDNIKKKSFSILRPLSAFFKRTALRNEENLSMVSQSDSAVVPRRNTTDSIILSRPLSAAPSPPRPPPVKKALSQGSSAEDIVALLKYPDGLANSTDNSRLDSSLSSRTSTVPNISRLNINSNVKDMFKSEQDLQKCSAANKFNEEYEKWEIGDISLSKKNVMELERKKLFHDLLSIRNKKFRLNRKKIIVKKPHISRERINQSKWTAKLFSMKDVVGTKRSKYSSQSDKKHDSLKLVAYSRELAQKALSLFQRKNQPSIYYGLMKVLRFRRNLFTMIESTLHEQFLETIHDDTIIWDKNISFNKKRMSYKTSSPKYLKWENGNFLSKCDPKNYAVVRDEIINYRSCMEKIKNVYSDIHRIYFNGLSTRSSLMISSKNVFLPSKILDDTHSLRDSDIVTTPDMSENETDSNYSEPPDYPTAAEIEEQEFWKKKSEQSAFNLKGLPGLLYLSKLVEERIGEHVDGNRPFSGKVFSGYRNKIQVSPVRKLMLLSLGMTTPDKIPRMKFTTENRGDFRPWFTHIFEIMCFGNGDKARKLIERVFRVVGKPMKPYETMDIANQTWVLMKLFNKMIAIKHGYEDVKLSRFVNDCLLQYYPHIEYNDSDEDNCIVARHERGKLPWSETDWLNATESFLNFAEYNEKIKPEVVACILFLKMVFKNGYSADIMTNILNLRISIRSKLRFIINLSPHDHIMGDMTRLFHTVHGLDRLPFVGLGYHRDCLRIIHEESVVTGDCQLATHLLLIGKCLDKTSGTNEWPEVGTELEKNRDLGYLLQKAMNSENFVVREPPTLEESFPFSFLSGDDKLSCSDWLPIIESEIVKYMTVVEYLKGSSFITKDCISNGEVRIAKRFQMEIACDTCHTPVFKACELADYGKDLTLATLPIKEQQKQKSLEVTSRRCTTKDVEEENLFPYVAPVSSSDNKTDRELQQAPVSHACQKCRRPLPRCTVCMCHFLSKDVDFEEEEGNNTMRSFATCISCNHGGHIRHLVDWFTAESTCPVTECDCKCLDLWSNPTPKDKIKEHMIQSSNMRARSHVCNPDCAEQTDEDDFL